MDDIIIFTKGWNEHLDEIEKLCSRLKEAGFTVRPSKCEFGMRGMEFLCHIIEEGGKIRPQECNKKKLEEAEQPKTKKGVRAFLGLTGFYRDFIPNYAVIAGPLTDLTRKGEPNKVIWSENCEKAFKNLKRMMVSDPLLRLPKMSERFILKTDAIDIALGFVLMQEYDDGVFPVAYGSKKLSEREKKYSTIEKEVLAIIKGIKRFEKFLFGKEFILETDHRSLIFFQQAKFENARVMRWAMALQQYKFRLRLLERRMS